MKRRIRGNCSLILAFCSVAICAAQSVENPWPMFHYNASRTGKSPFGGPQSCVIKWTYKLFSDVFASPVLDSEGAIYVGTDDGSDYGKYQNLFYRIDSVGSLSWSYCMRELIYSTAATIANKVFIGDFDHHFYCFFTNGVMSWSYLTGGDVDYGSSPAVNGDAVWIGIDDDRLYNFQHGGQLSWSYKTHSHIHSSPALDESYRAYIGSGDHNLYCLDSLGAFSWSYETGDEILSSPAVSSDRNVYVGSYDNSLYSIGSAGALRWSYKTMGIIEYAMVPAISTDNVWIGSKDASLYCLTTGGQLSWSYWCSPVYSAPSISATDTVYVGSTDGRIYHMDPAGGLVWSFYSGSGSDIHSSPAIDPDTIYFGTAYQNVLYALTEPSPTPTHTCTPTPTSTSTPNPPPTFPPGLRVWTNKSSFNPGDTLEIWGSFTNTILDWDAYMVIMGNGKTWSVTPKNTLKKGIYALVKKAMEMHYDYLVGYGFGPVRIFYMRVPSGASGYYTVYCAILPTGTKPTMNNARGPYSQLSIAGFQIIR